MQDKIEQQLGLARRIRAVDENDVAARAFPDLEKYQSTVPEEAEAWAISRKFPVPLYPEFVHLNS